MTDEKKIYKSSGLQLHEYRVAASCFEPEASHDMARRRLSLCTHLAELLHSQHPDLLVLPETVIAIDIGQEEFCGAETIDGPTVSMVSEIAAVSKTNICVPIIEDCKGKLFNTAVYVDRSGGVAGIYRKQVPTFHEIEVGICPGQADQRPVTIDGLRIGTAICFDENFPDLIWRWIESGIDLLVFPSYSYAGELMRNWALNCGVPLVCSFPWESVIYDRDGGALVRAGTEASTVRLGHHPPWIACTLNFRSRIYHLDFNQEHLIEINARYGAKIDVRLMVPDGRMMLTVHAPDIDLESIEHEFRLVPLQEYLRNSRALCQSGWSGNDPEKIREILSAPPDA